MRLKDPATASRGFLSSGHSQVGYNGLCASNVGGFKLVSSKVEL